MPVALDVAYLRCHSSLGGSGGLGQGAACAGQHPVRGAGYLMASQTLEQERIETSDQGHNSCLNIGPKSWKWFFFPLKSKTRKLFCSGCKPCWNY